MARMTISIPDSLKEAMIRVARPKTSGREVNWSAVATEAFRLVVERHGHRIPDGSGVIRTAIQEAERRRERARVMSKLDDLEEQIKGLRSIRL